MAETTQTVELAAATKERFIRYAVSVITSRALPDIRDGLKPVHRRILYAMQHDLRLRPDGKHMKSAKVVGQVMGNYHPHGDSAIYEAMVRMAQDHSLRYPLVDGQGNFGAVTGDNAAAQRYTEAKLTPLGAALMETLDEDTVEVRPTYDEATTEPVSLPTPLPLLLLNGSSGIAVGMATNIPPHNMRETLKACVTLIDKPESTVAQLMRSIKGPDFPMGGELLATRDEILAVYERGHGSLKLRGTYHEEEGEKETARQRVVPRYLVIDSIPYGTNTQQITSKVGELIDNKKLPGVIDVSDQTTEETGLRVVLEVDQEADAALIMAAVYRLTPLQTSFGVNLTALVPGQVGEVAQPKRHLNLKTILRVWLDSRLVTYTRALQFRKRKLDERIHILEGYLTVMSKLDDAIKIVRKAKDKADARVKLMKRFKLDELQANAVLEIQLYRLAQLEIQKLQDELKIKAKESKRLGRLLKSKKLRWAEIKKELQGYIKAYSKDKRRTRLVADDEEHTFDPNALIRREDTHVIVTKAGRIKRIRRVDDFEKVRVQKNDEIEFVVQGSTLACVLFLTSTGACYTLRINDVPSTTGFGEPIQAFFKFTDGERVIQVISSDPRLLMSPERGLVVASSGGNIARCSIESYLEPSTKAGRRYAKLSKGERVVGVEAPEEDVKTVILASIRGRALCVDLKEIPILAGLGRGRRALVLDKKKEDGLVGMTTRKNLVLETTRGGTTSLTRRTVPKGTLGSKGKEVMTRYYFRNAVLPTWELYELPEDEEA
ncbi:MAG: DNA topoisomerase 4 subunit A [Planctomycetes bacterium]|nr:DNA topoisomerase 4 subunit A [Planctomycetota bacterium]